MSTLAECLVNWRDIMSRLGDIMVCVCVWGGGGYHEH